MVTVNSWGSNIPVGEAKGGLDQSTYSTGDMIYASASNTLSKLPIGTAGQKFKLASGLPTWATQAAGGLDWTEITSGSLSGSSLLVTSGLGTNYGEYRFLLEGISGSSTGFLEFSVSDNGGSTYVVAMDMFGFTAATYGFDSTTPLTYGDNVSTNSDFLSGIITGNKSGTYKTFTSVFTSSGGKDDSNIWNGLWKTANDIDALSFALTAGNFDAGTYLIEGR